MTNASMVPPKSTPLLSLNTWPIAAAAQGRALGPVAPQLEHLPGQVGTKYCHNLRLLGGLR